MQGVSKTDFENYVKANDAVLRNIQRSMPRFTKPETNFNGRMLSKFISSNTASSSNSGTLPSQTVTNPREHVNAITTRSGKTCEGPSTPLVPTSVVSTPLKEPEQNPETSMDKAKETVQEPISPDPNSYQPKLPYPERMKVREKDKPSAQQSREFFSQSGASINLLPHSIYKQLGLGALKPTRMTLELANRFVTHPMGIAEDVVVRVDGFTFLADFVVVNFEPDPRVPIILGRPFLRTAKALIDLYEEKLTLRVGSDELVFYAEKSEKSKNKQFAHAISASDNLEEFADEFTLLNSFPPDNDDSILKKDVHEENFQVYSNPLFEFDDNFNSSNVNPLFNEMVEDVENENSNVSNSDEPVFLNTPLTDKVECFDPEDNIDEIDAFLAMEVSSNFEEGYYDSEGDVIFLENLLSDDTTHNLAPEVIFDHEPKQNESIHNTSITFSPRNDPLHHEFAGELLTLPSRIVREHEEYLSLMTVLCEISTSRSQENVHANPSSIIESLPVSLIPVEDSDPVQEEIDIFPGDLIPPGVENDDSEDEDNSTFLPKHESPNLDHQDNPSAPRPPPEPPDVKIHLEPDTAMINNFDVLNKEACFNLEEGVQIFLPFFTYPEDSPFILSLRSEDLVFDPGISNIIIVLLSHSIALLRTNEFRIESSY
ncbi:reverse transcriptase domain-containing protein [Tanacetum coccineum]